MYIFLILWIKKCPKCFNSCIQKWGYKNGKQNYKCKNCGHSFQNKSRKRKNKWVEQAYNDYSRRRQTLADLRYRYGKDVKTIRKYFDNHSPSTGEIIDINESVNLVFDGTFFKRTKGLLVFRANQRNIYWKYIKSETITNISIAFDTVDAICKYGYKSFTIDGRRGILMWITELKNCIDLIPKQSSKYHCEHSAYWSC